MPMQLGGFYFDEYGLIVQQDGDGGDTMNRMGLYELGDYWGGGSQEARYQMACVRLEPYRHRLNTWVRHPSQPKWNKTEGPDAPTRDQFIPNEIAMGYAGSDAWVSGQRERYARLIKAKLKRISRYQSGDLSAPHHWGANIRALGFWPLYPWLVFSDVALVAEVLLICLLKGRTPGKFQKKLGDRWHVFVREYEDGGWYGADSVDDMNVFIMLRQAQDRFPTPLSWLASVLYVWLRPESLGKYKNPKAHPILQAWLWYFRSETGACDFARIYAPIINEFVEDYSWKRSLMTLLGGLPLVMRQVMIPLLSFGMVRAVTR
jgi:hypothetical protein